MSERLAPQVPSALLESSELYVRQQREGFELLGVETRNKYGIFTADRQQVAYAAEQGKGLMAMFARQVLGHMRTFEIQFFDPARAPLFKAVHPFRLFFQRLEVFAGDGRPVGALQQRFGLFTKKFDVLDARGNLLFEMRSGLFRVWSFPFLREGQQHAVIEKRWSGALTELFTDKDNFRVSFTAPSLTADERLLVLAAAIFVDLQYFEANQGTNALNLLDS